MTKLLAWSEGKTRQFHSAMAAFLGGYLVFGKRTSVNEQVSRKSNYNVRPDIFFRIF